ncbi:MAG: hypothetical protein ABEH86_12910 [Haloarcula sp.]
MDQLSSCYFCGGALDVSLSEYPIIPKTVEPDAEKQGTVILCSTCREKLATIVGPVVEAAKADATDTAVAAGDAGATESPGLLDDSGTPAVDEPTTTDSVVAPTDDESLLGDDAATVDEQAPLDQTHEQSSSSAQSAETADSSPQPDATETTDVDTSDDTSDDPSLTRLEYNKVMRLLQNRELPVDRGAIREVAVNAYDIESEQFDTIIDAAIERDLIGQESGQLTEAEQ